MPNPDEQRQRNTNQSQAPQDAAVSAARSVVIGFGRDFTASLERSQRNVPLPVPPSVICK